jgi:hypothetical protein
LPYELLSKFQDNIEVVIGKYVCILKHPPGLETIEKQMEEISGNLVEDKSCNAEKITEIKNNSDAMDKAREEEHEIDSKNTSQRTHGETDIKTTFVESHENQTKDTKSEDKKRVKTEKESKNEKTKKKSNASFRIIKVEDDKVTLNAPPGLDPSNESKRNEPEHYVTEENDSKFHTTDKNTISNLNNLDINQNDIQSLPNETLPINRENSSSVTTASPFPTDQCETLALTNKAGDLEGKTEKFQRRNSKKMSREKIEAPEKSSNKGNCTSGDKKFDQEDVCEAAIPGTTAR